MTASKIVLNAASGVGGAGLDVEEVFSTYLYTGNGSTQTITNGINLGDNLTGPYTEIAEPNASAVGGYLYRNSDLSGNADGKALTFSGWAYNTGDNLYLYNSRTLQDSGTASFNAIMSNGLFKVESYNSSDTKILDTGWRTVSLNVWFHFLISVDLSSTSNRYLYINDVEELGPSSSWNTYTNDSINFTNSHHYVNAYRSSANNGVQAGGGLAQIYLDYTYRDLSVVSNRRTFVTANIAPAGNLSSLNPILYLPFDATNSTGSNLGTGGNFVAYNTSYFTAKETGGPGYDAGSGEGGLVVIKRRDGSANNWGWYDTERGPDSHIKSNGNNAENTQPNVEVKDFNSNGFNLGIDHNAYINTNGGSFASWTFRKAPKLFDVVTYTGDGNEPSAWINHSLGQVPGLIIIKRTDNTSNWFVHHRSLGRYENILLNSTASKVTQYVFDNTTNGITSTQFRIHFGGGNDANISGATYVAYLFAHNNNDGEFGPNADADIIKCGSFTDSSSGWSVDLGFEPQFLLTKRVDSTGNWEIVDTMRGFTADRGYERLFPNLSNVENVTTKVGVNSTGFFSTTAMETNGATIIYIAIRRGTKVPESGTEVFAVSDRKNEIPSFPSGFPVDFCIGGRNIDSADNSEVKTRLISGGYLRTNTTGAETTSDQSENFAHNDGFFNFAGPNANQYSWMWKRAPKYMDVVAYQGTGIAGFTFNHNLGVVPEMIWVKNRGASEYWAVYHKGLNGGTNPSHYYLKLNDTNAETDYNEIWNDTEPTATQVTVGQQGVVNSSSFSHIAYLFATLDGISKVGSYTGTGSSQNIDCGFSSGARFVLVKRYDGVDSWYIVDSVRGISSGQTDKILNLNTTDAQFTESDNSADYIAPHASGFNLPANSPFNGSGDDFIFYAIA